MTIFSDTEHGAIRVTLVRAEASEEILASLPAEQAAQARTNGFDGKASQTCLLTNENGLLDRVLFGLGDGEDFFSVAPLVRVLPVGVFRIDEGAPFAPADMALALAMQAYRFSSFKSDPADDDLPQFVFEPSPDIEEAKAIAEAVVLTRDLVNTPASHMGPEELSHAARQLAEKHGATFSEVAGDELLTKGYEMIHAVGRASSRAPRLIDISWGSEEAPRITLVGKGVCFDTGGLNLKPGSSITLMKKDMGGAANVIGLAHMIMSAGLQVRLRVLIPAVENAVGSNAFRPGDVLKSYKGLTVEIENTDAEGRLILGDALALADEEAPDMLIDMATLTGAARVAMGPEVVPFYSEDSDFVSDVMSAGEAVLDPAWQLPLWQPYAKGLSSKVADIAHTAPGGFAGSITAALFLQKFVEKAKIWAHFDIYAWNPKDRSGRPTGGEAQAVRAIFKVLKDRYQ